MSRRELREHIFKMLFRVEFYEEEGYRAGYKEWNKNNCEFAKDCKEKECNCKTSIMKCDYLGIIDDEDDTLLWDSCKECGEHDKY